MDLLSTHHYCSTITRDHTNSNIVAIMSAAIGVTTYVAMDNKMMKNKVSCEEGKKVSQAEDLEKDWEKFMIKSMNPEDDDDDDEEEEEEEEEIDSKEEDEEMVLAEEVVEEAVEELAKEVVKEVLSDVIEAELNEDNEEDIEPQDSVEIATRIIEEKKAAELTIPDPKLEVESQPISQTVTEVVADNSEDELNHAEDDKDLESYIVVDDNITTKKNMDESPMKEETKEEQVDPYNDLPEEDEPTACVICLINRQGPCRPHWRKFERCMKENSSENDNDSNNSDENAIPSKPSMADQCDKYMIPWISCIQNYRNTYTLISNDFFQHELIQEIEKGVKENEKVLLENIDTSSIIQINNDWWGGKTNEKNTGASSANEEDGPQDALLVEGLARINLFDGQKPIEAAYIKDQDGNLLGYDQFTEFKKSIGSKDENDDSQISNDSKVGQCNFHVSPDTTKTIQIFALYKALGNNGEDPGNEVNESKETSSVSTEQTLYISTPVVLDDLPNPSELETEVNASL